MYNGAMPNDYQISSTLGQSNPQISVIMATYNRAECILAALKSILRQDYAPLEIIVIDDGSTDTTHQVVAALIAETEIPIRYVRQENRGQPSAFNHALRLTQGEVIAFLDDDDLWPENRLPAQLAYFSPGSSVAVDGVGIVLGRKEYFADGVRVDESELAGANQRPFHYSLGAALIARWVFDRVGIFDDTVSYVADWDWFARARHVGISMSIAPRVTLLGRLHGGNITQNRDLGAHLTVEVIRRHMKRTRGQPSTI